MGEGWCFLLNVDWCLMFNLLPQIQWQFFTIYDSWTKDASFHQALELIYMFQYAVSTLKPLTLLLSARKYVLSDVWMIVSQHYWQYYLASLPSTDKSCESFYFWKMFEAFISDFKLARTYTTHSQCTDPLYVYIQWVNLNFLAQVL